MSTEKQKTILLVDDEAIIAMTEKMTLEKYGYEVIIANTGEEAVATVEKIPAIDLVLMDINLGAGIDGPEAAAIILRHRDLPVVFLSSHTEPDVVEKTEKITSYGYVVKNSSITVLDASIKMAFKLFEAKIKEKEKEEALGKSEEKFRQLFTLMPSAVAIYDAVDGGEDFVFKDFNIAAEKIEGIKKNDLVGKRVTQVFPGVKGFGIFAVFQRVWRTGQPEFFPSAVYRDERDPGTWRENWVYKLASGEVIAIYHDITERKQAEEAIFQSKKDWEDCFDSISDMITIHDNDYNIIRTNKAGKALLKLPEFEEHLKLKCFSFFHGTAAPPKGCPSCDCLKSGMPGVFELFEPYLNRYLEIRAIPRFDSNNQRSGLIHIVRDITERKLEDSQRADALKALRENEERFRTLYENSTIGIYRTTPDGMIHLANPALVKMLGYSSFADLSTINLKKNGFESSYPRTQFIEIIEKDGEVKGIESAWTRKDGAIIFIRESARAIRDSQAKTLYYDGIVEDITERKQAEKLTEALYKISQAIYATDNLNELFEHVHRALANIITTDNLFIALLSDDGKTLTFPYYIDEKDSGDAPAIEVDNLQSLTVEVFKTKKPLLFDEAELNDRYASGRNNVWGTVPKCWLGVPLFMKETVIGVLAVQDYHKCGVYSRKDVTLLESTAGQIAIAIDRKRAESQKEAALDALRVSEGKFRSLVENINDVLFILDVNGQFTYVSPVIELINGRKPDDFIGKNFSEFVHPDDLPFLIESFKRTMGGARESFEFRIYNGEQIQHVRTSSQIFLNDGVVAGITGLMSDINERKQAEELLQASEERYRQLVENTDTGLVVIDDKGIVINANEPYLRLVGARRLEEVIGHSVTEWTAPDQKENNARAVALCVVQGFIQDFETVYQHANGTRTDIIINATVEEASKGAKHIASLCRDISERKQAEKLAEALLAISRAVYSTDSLNELFAHVHHALSNIIPTANLFIALISDDGKQLTFPYSIDEKDTKNTFVIELANTQSLTVEIFKTKRPLLLDEMELLDRYTSGRNKVWGTAPKCWLGVPLIIRETVIGVLAVQDYHNGRAFSREDVSLLESAAGQIAIAIERKRAAEEIKRQLAEKEILLREVHHRIKNNIAAIGGLLSLHLKSVTNPEAVAVLRDAIGRVDSMGILYDKLLLTEDYKDLSVKNYIESLVDMVIALFPGSAKIKLEKYIDDFRLDPKRLFPLGIIIHELLTNKMKYAFSQRKTGLIKVSLVNVEKHVTLAIQDNGNRLPDDFDSEKSKGFGLMLVKMLSQQLGGSFSLEKHKGTRCTVEFDV